jgi:hypothetical protein
MRARTQDAIRLFSPLFAVLPPELFYIEILPNEKYLAGAELSQLSYETAICARDIALSGARPVGFNIAVGNPTLADVSRMQEGAEALVSYDGAVGYHNYAVPGAQLSKDLDLRHEAMKSLLPKGTKWVLNEGLYDHGIIDGRLAGWRDSSFRLMAADVVRYVRRIAQHLSADPSVVMWTPFGAGCEQHWIDLGFQYDNEDEITAIFQELYEVGDLGESPSYKIGEGFRRMVPYLGEPLENEVYHFPATPMEASLAVFANGTATWFKAANETVGIRSDGTIFTDKGNHGDGQGTVYRVNSNVLTPA